MTQARAQGSEAVALDPVDLQILWGRLVAEVEESVTTLTRTAFSASVRESNDLTCVLMDADGSAIAQSAVSAPIHTGVKGVTMRALLKKYPLAEWRPGDAAISNDPWIGNGHRFDVTIARPIFHRGRLVGFALNDAHWADLGGGGMLAENRDLYAEGLGIPNCKIVEAGRPVDEVFEFIHMNTRLPDETLGDLHAQLAAAERMGERVANLLEATDLDDLTGVAQAIYDRTEASMRNAIRRLRRGTFTSDVVSDGLDEPLYLRASVMVDPEHGIIVDYAGSSSETGAALNCVFNYTYAWTIFALRAMLDPDTPHNDGCLRPFEVRAPEGSVLNARWGAPVSVRHQTGHYIPTLILNALGQSMPEYAIGECGAPPHRSYISGRHADGSHYGVTLNAAGGFGASASNDGAHAMAFPTNTVCISLETLERLYPLVFWRRELVRDSGGTGRRRGGCGQLIDFEFVGPTPGWLSPLVERTKVAPKGVAGGGPGGVASMTRNGVRVRPKALIRVQPGDRLVLKTAGGGGHGDPAQREAEAVMRDVQNGLVSASVARREYGTSRRRRSRRA